MRNFPLQEKPCTESPPPPYIIVYCALNTVALHCHATLSRYKLSLDTVAVHCHSTLQSCAVILHGWPKIILSTATVHRLIRAPFFDWNFDERFGFFCQRAFLQTWETQSCIRDGVLG